MSYEFQVIHEWEYIAGHFSGFLTHAVQTSLRAGFFGLCALGISTSGNAFLPDHGLSERIRTSPSLPGQYQHRRDDVYSGLQTSLMARAPTIGTIVSARATSLPLQ
jgi:hypothetical protein